MARAKTVVTITPETLRCIRRVWNSIAADVGECSNKEAIELCLDANRMTTFCGPAGEKADTEISGLIEAHGWSVLLTAVHRQVQLA